MENALLVITLLGFFLSLVLIGEPLRYHISRFSKLFEDLDLLRASLLDFFLGGAVLYLLALIPFPPFTFPIILGTLILGVGLTVFLHRGSFAGGLSVFKSPRNIIDWLKSRMNYLSVEYVLVIGMFLTILIIHLGVQQQFIFGEPADYAWHSLISQKILEEGRLVLTTQPYVLGFGLLTYPQGFHVLSAYACYLFDWSPPEAVTNLTVLFHALPIIGGYFLGKSLEGTKGNHLGLAFAFLFGFVSRWPKLMAWGSNAFILGFPFFLICLSCLPLILKKDTKWGGVLLLGFLLGYLCVIHPVYYFALIPCYLIMIFLFRVSARRSLFFLAVLGVSLVFIAYPIVYAHIYDFIVPPQVPIELQREAIRDIQGGIAQLQEAWHQFNSGDWISAFPMLRNLIKFLIPASVLYLAIARKKEHRQVIAISVSLIAAGALVMGISLAGFLTGLKIIPEIPLQEVEYIIYTSVLLFVGLLFADIFSIMVRVKISASNVLLAVFSLLLLLSPFIYYGGVVGDRQYLEGQYKLHNPTTEDDYNLMLWIKENIPEDSLSLIHI